MDGITLASIVIIGGLIVLATYVTISAVITIKSNQQGYQAYWLMAPEYEEERKVLLLAGEIASRQQERKMPPLLPRPVREKEIKEEIFEDIQEEEQEENIDPLDISMGSEEVTVEGPENLAGLYDADPEAYACKISEIRNRAMDHYNSLFDRTDGVVKIIRDTNKAGYPGLVAKASDPEGVKSRKISRDDWDHCFKDGGILWLAGALTYDEEKNVIFHPEEKDRLEAWFQTKGYTIKPLHVEDYDE